MENNSRTRGEAFSSRETTAEQKDSAEILQEYLQRATTLYEQLSFWRSKGDKNLRNLVQDVEDESASIYPYTHGSPEEIQEKTASLKSSVDQACCILSNFINKLLKSEKIEQGLEDKIGKKIKSLDEAKDTARELIRPFHEEYLRHLRANGGKGKRTRDAMSSEQAAWDIASKAIPSNLEIMDDENLQKIQEQRSKFQEMLSKLVLLPGPHQEYAKALAEGRGNAQDANHLLNSYTFASGKASNRFKKLDVEYNRQDLKDLGILIEGASKFTAEVQQKLGIEIPVVPEGISVETAESILGKEHVVGPDEVKQVWGVELAEVPAIPYSEEDLEKAKNLGMYLILRVDRDKEGKILSGQRMNEMKQTEFERNQKGKILYDTDWYKNEEFFTNETPKLSWALTSGDILPGSTSNNYVHQTRILRDHLKTQGWLTEEDETSCSDEILRDLSTRIGLDWNTQRITNKNVYNNNWQAVAEELSKLAVNQNHRQSFCEVLYDFISILESKNKRILIDKYSWTNTRSSSGDLVSAGICDDAGALVVGWKPGVSGGDLGVFFSR